MKYSSTYSKIWGKIWTSGQCNVLAALPPDTDASAWMGARASLEAVARIKPVSLTTLERRSPRPQPVALFKEIF
jgi:hypothetical protein